MTMHLDATHDPLLGSWVASANAQDSDFPIQNLPLGVFKRKGEELSSVGVALGDQVLNLSLATSRWTWDADVQAALAMLASGDLAQLMAQGTQPRRALRAALSQALKVDSPASTALAPCLVAQSDVVMQLPCFIHDYTDFYTGIYHATAIGKLFRPDSPLLPNYKWVPIGYHGRASTLGVSGQSFHRPMGQLKGAADAPSFGPCQRLDHELELGILVGKPNQAGQRIPITRAEDHIFGMVLLNDWSARDIQAWEYQPLGPFLAKSFATTISPWVVTMEALAPFRVPFLRPADDPQPLPYLDSQLNRSAGSLNLQLETLILTPKMKGEGMAAHRLMSSNFKDSYWTIAQLLTHHTSNGCKMNPGDLMGSGTQSGPGVGQGGSLLELTQGGKQPIVLPNGEQRLFLQDGDTVVLRAHAQQAGARRIGFGDCHATVLPALAG